MTKPIYLDYNATTPLDVRVFKEMEPWFTSEFGNSGSRTHEYGQRAKRAVDKSRNQVASILDADPSEIIFTSGATESNNIVLLGLSKYGEKINKKHIISTVIEHKSVLEPLNYLSNYGFDVDLAPVKPDGCVDPETIKKLIRDDTLLISIMHSNNETGVIQPLKEIQGLILGRDILFHSDAAQTYGKEVDELKGIPLDFISISGHKIYGPKGIGALYIRRKSGHKNPLEPIYFGGGQEKKLRPGTLPVPLIVGLGITSEIASNEYSQRNKSAKAIKEKFLKDISEINCKINGNISCTQNHIISITFPGIDSEALMMMLGENMAISNGSACTSDTYSPSHVLLSMGLNEDDANSTIRFSWGVGIDSIDCKKLIDKINTIS